MADFCRYSGCNKHKIPVLRRQEPWPNKGVYARTAKGGLLREDVRVIHIELLESDAQEQAERALDERAEQLVKQAKRMRRRVAGGETLHAALRACSGWIDRQYAELDGRLDAWGVVQKRQVDFLERHLPNCALVELTAHRIDEFFNVLRRRPLRENGKRITWIQLATASNSFGASDG